MIYQIYGTDAHAMTKALMERADVAAMIPKNASVALKPNLVIAAAAEGGATTHPGVLSGAIEYLQAHGVKAISVMEGSWVGDSTEKAFKAAGYDTVCAAYQVPFFNLKKDETKSVQTPIGAMDICRRALESDFLIDLPVLKGHCQTAMTCALKNLKGCLPDKEKRRFHALGLTRPIAALSAVLKPKLVIVDSLCGDLNFEEGGTPVATNRMFIGTDPVQIDAYGCRLMGLSLSDVPYLALAERFGAGTTQLSDDELVDLNQPSMAADYPKPSGTVAKLTRQVREDNACSACFAALVRALYTSGGDGGRSIAIGQGWRGKPFDGLGVGNCCSSARRCVKGCPPTAESIGQALKNRS